MSDEFASALAGSSSQSNDKPATTQKSLDPPRPKDKLHSISKKSIQKSSSYYPSSRSLERRLDAMESRLNANESKTQSQLDAIQSLLTSLVDGRAAASPIASLSVGNAVPSSLSQTQTSPVLAFPPPELPSSSSFSSPGQLSNALFCSPSTSALSTPIVSNLFPVISTPSSSSVSSSSFPFVVPQPPFPVVSTSVISDQLLSQLKAGERTPLELQTKIINDEFVDFHDILFPDSASKFILSFQPNNSPMLIKDSKRRDLSENQWNKAFAEFSAIYAKAHPSAVSDLFTYQKRILYLMERKANWHYFDVQFRKDKQIAKSSWTDPRSDLYLDCLLQTSSPSVAHSIPRSLNPSDSPRPKIPYGFCFSYNSPNVRCHSIPCNFKHVCPTCSQKHPLYLHDRNNSSRQGTHPVKQPAHQSRAAHPPVAR